MFIKEWFIDVNYICKIVCIPEDYLKISYTQIKQHFLPMTVYCLSKIIQGKHTIYLKNENNNNRRNLFITMFETTITMYPSIYKEI